MSKKQSPAESSGMVNVRALKDDALHGLVAGMAASVPGEAVDAMKAAGLIDDHPDAVAYAKANA